MSDYAISDDTAMHVQIYSLGRESPAAESSEGKRKREHFDGYVLLYVRAHLETYYSYGLNLIKRYNIGTLNESMTYNTLDIDRLTQYIHKTFTIN